MCTELHNTLHHDDFSVEPHLGRDETEPTDNLHSVCTVNIDLSWPKDVCMTDAFHTLSKNITFVAHVWVHEGLSLWTYYEEHCKKKYSWVIAVAVELCGSFTLYIVTTWVHLSLFIKPDSLVIIQPYDQMSE